MADVCSRAEDAGVRFLRFNDFPAEIRCLIWEHAVPDDVPEVHILKPSSQRPHARPMVDVAFPAVMHASQEARAACRRRLRMRVHHCESPPGPAPDDAGDGDGGSSKPPPPLLLGRRPPPVAIEVPCREFRPDLDVMFIGAHNFYAFFNRPEFFYGGMVRRLRHVAVDIVLATSAGRIANVLRFLDSLETVSVVFEQPGQRHGAGQALLLQRSTAARRCRLRALTADECESTVVSDRPRARDYQPVPLYLSNVKREVEHTTKQLLPALEGEARVALWDYEKRKLSSRLKFDAQTFEEYAGGEWRGKQRQQTRLSI
jgi:hypothetical protein